ncbi:hypothetical protein SBOR_3163 [Sclerotinia borealis F-4128]|uniref:2EXR domain-containing protein n=1 Tax=Sclerotinia borealis (strain F-4128) TaxID=1432307 RepID=W9CKQ9_SCLBF|nr:hypothetical protein SBOR_3163 [Sclerotinia borealis F-4128]
MSQNPTIQTAYPVDFTGIPSPLHYPNTTSPSSPHMDASGCPELSILSINVFYSQKDINIKQCESNCRSLEVDILYSSHSLDYYPLEQSSTDKKSEQIMEQAKNPLIPADRPIPFESLSHDITSSLINNSTSTSSQSSFPFLSLPIEIRLKIYLLLLPPRHHKITTQIPHNGYYFPPTSIPCFAAQSFYPVHPNTPQKLTTYKILSANSHTDHPNPSIHTRILSVCKQTKEEAEEVLYGNGKSIWDFGMNIEAMNPFWHDRSQGARAWIRNLRIAREIPMTAEICAGRDVVWDDVCRLIMRELSGLRYLDLTVWGNAITASRLEGLLASRISQVLPLDEGEVEVKDEDDEAQKQREKVKHERDIYEWEWGYTRKLLEHGGLSSAKVTWWGFREGVKTFLAKWMLESESLTEEMVREGDVVQGVKIWNGSGDGNGDGNGNGV